MDPRPRSSPFFRAVGIIIALVFVALTLALPLIPPAHANPSVVQDVKSATLASGSHAVSIASTTSGNLLLVMYYSTNTACGAQPTGGNVAFFTEVHCDSEVSGVAGAIDSWIGITTGSSSSVTVGAGGQPNSNYVVEILEISGVSTPATYSDGHTSSTSPVNATVASVSPPSGAFIFVGANAQPTGGTTCSISTVTPGYTASVMGCNPLGGGFNNNMFVGEYIAGYTGAATKTPVGITFNGGASATWVAMAVIIPTPTFTTTVTTTTSVATTSTATATTAVGQVGGSPANATHYQLATNQMYVAYTQNVINQPAVVSNITLKVFAVTVRSSTATLRLGVYMVSTPGQVPSSIYPLQLQAPTFAFQLVNNSGTQFVHVPTGILQSIQLTICGSCYYGIGVVADSNGTAGGLSGIYIFAASPANQVQIPNLYDPFHPGTQFQPGWACIPAPENSGTDPVPSNWYTYPYQPRCYEFAYAAFTQYAVNIVVRAGSTTTVTTNAGTTTSTVTVSGTTTLTTTTEDAVTAGIANNALLYVLLATMGGLFFVGLWAGGLGGGIFGAIIGIVIGIASGIITGQYATLSIVATLIGAMAAIQLGRRGGRGGL